MDEMMYVVMYMAMEHIMVVVMEEINDNVMMDDGMIIQ